MAKKVIALVMALSLCLALFAGCNNTAKEKAKTETKTDATDDWGYIADKGELVIGYTIYEPMNYLDGSGTLIGFDTEFATAVCKQLGVKAKFVEINWDTKEVELNAKNIDCIWNGFTLSEERKAQFDFATSYLYNRQIAVVKASNADKYSAVDKMAGAAMTAETESAGESTVQENAVLSKNAYIAANKQTDALLEVKSGTSEIAVVDYIMAKFMTGEGTDYADLALLEGVKFSDKNEEYAVGFRKNSPSTIAKVNEAIAAIVKDGTVATIAAKYNLTDALTPALQK